MSSAVKLDLILEMIIHQVVISSLFFKHTDTESISIQVCLRNKKYQYQYLEI